MSQRPIWFQLPLKLQSRARSLGLSCSRTDAPHTPCLGRLLHPTQIRTPTTATATNEAAPQISHAHVAGCRHHRSHRSSTSATATEPTGFGWDARDSARRRTFASARAATPNETGTTTSATTSRARPTPVPTSSSLPQQQGPSRVSRVDHRPRGATGTTTPLPALSPNCHLVFRSPASAQDYESPRAYRPGIGVPHRHHNPAHDQPGLQNSANHTDPQCIKQTGTGTLGNPCHDSFSLTCRYFRLSRR
ncbi:hypothetical protein M2275_008127 [Rhodococcus opacus]|nr:hypothetical protein [Rhodococcus opacus]